MGTIGLGVVIELLGEDPLFYESTPSDTSPKDFERKPKNHGVKITLPQLDEVS